MSGVDSILIMTAIACCCWAVVAQQRQLDDMAEDIDLLLDGEMDLVKAKRALNGRRTGRDPQKGTRL